MPPRSKPATRGAALVFLGLTLALSGCGGPSTLTNNSPKTSSEAPIKPVDVSDEAFAQSLAEVLRDGSRSPERLALLAGVVRRQLTHADKRFVLGDAERATRSVLGALYLLRVNEGQGAMIDETGARALDGAIKHLSGTGDEGRVYPLMRMRAAAIGQGNPAKVELDEHAANLEQWLHDTHQGSAGQRLGSEARYLVARAMVDPSEDAIAKAADAVEAWVARGIEINRVFRATGKRPERAEGMEAARALETGAMMLTALYARHGDAMTALTRIEGSELRLVTDPALRRTLVAAAEDGDARAWQNLARIFLHQSLPTEGEEEDREERLPIVLLEAGLWGSAIEAYRKDPTDLRTAVMLAQSLGGFGLSEAVPLVLTNSLGTNPNPRALSLALEAIFDTMKEDADAGDTETVHRTYRAAAPIIALADRPDMQGSDIQLNRSKIWTVMATAWMRAGDLASARPLFVAAAKATPFYSAWMNVARADRQTGNREGALDSVKRAIAAPDARPHVAEAQLENFMVYREMGRLDEAKAALEAALQSALETRNQVKGRAASPELVLGRVLDAYGDAKDARRAYDRALTIGLTSGEADTAVFVTIGRALLRKDLELARAALHEGLEANIGRDVRIYCGLWVLLLEREMHASMGEDTARALAISGDRDAWITKLATWGSGKMTDDALVSAAQTAAQKVEAEFYTAMSKRASGDVAANSRLKVVAESPVVELVEIEMARELVAPPFRADLPKGVVLP